jgi:hypothetical protein
MNIAPLCNSQVWRAAVKAAVSCNVECSNDQWKHVPLSNYPALKFRIINDTLNRTAMQMSNFELTSINNIEQLLHFHTAKENEIKIAIEPFMKRINVDNVSFIPKPEPIVVHKTIVEKVYKKNRS